MMVWKMVFLFEGCILRFHVNLPGCIADDFLELCGVKTNQNPCVSPPEPTKTTLIASYIPLLFFG